ncbi:MAG: YggT family protein [Chloroflexota bacterium]|nr:YggT family protein [Chloroflexota bacterium]
MTYRREESNEVYRDANGAPVERRVVAEERAVGEPVAYGSSVPYAETTPLPTEVVRERVVEQPYAAVPVRNEVVRERVVEQPYAAAPVRDEYVSDRVVEDESVGRLSALDLATRIIWFLTGLLLVGLVARFILKATGANTASSFVSFIYNATAAFVAPFRGIFSDSASGSNVLEVSTIVAIVVWALIAFFVTWLLGILLGGPSRGVREYRRDVRRY